ncbi:dodecenoyl-CoA isomerase KNAG_0F03070 [Huiozyma naganishii CBS 8797]|uniref:3-hydroxyisobutyryl-CoA hydrolase, mitochondrial n=1 Tax=Huiozyma naganishii (strain ATCC MYA-139 / BCRC 22969 / CBS 8797 / KCTC 17520 / NBRC 10181 / NCYC 3082 / Yp74L-3) TaxID=1071383 RepID=J7S7I0_HUIN7|nr:hypothetical protein KNAG_0F03070 [Kazachstania naganishii CBS 8797]CCK70969.1 hypothetical protein KNAG_0F03070 [Kazachstania naganishii CBS 8797]
MTMKPEDKISGSVDGCFYVIKFNCPQTLNAMSYDDFLYTTRLLDRAERDPNVYFTVLQSSGKYFSSGADFRSVPNNPSGDEGTELTRWLENFLAKNQYITSSFIKHSKVLIACLNGPAIGLSAAIVLLCDLVYSMDARGTKNFLQFPFSQLGLSCEGATSVTLPQKIGRNAASTKLFFGERLYFADMLHSVINRDYALDDGDVDKFNTQVMQDLRAKIRGLYLPAVLQMKDVLRASNDTVSKLELANSKEVHGALPYWVDGEPQRRFARLRDAKLAARGRSKI